MNLLAIIVPLVLILTIGSIIESTFWELIFITDFEKTFDSSKIIPIETSGIDFASGAFSVDDLKVGNSNELFLANFENWARDHDIYLVGTNKNFKHLFKRGMDLDKDVVELKDVPGVLIAAEALYKIPDNVLEVMAGKTIYFSTQKGRSIAVFTSGSGDHHNRGFIIEQNVSAGGVIHELGHIVDGHGIQGLYRDKQNIFSYAKEERDKIFEVTLEHQPNATGPPPGYITRYATYSDLENFADNFAYYVIYPDVFRDRMKNDPLLVDEYEFLRDFVFNGKEY